MVSFELGKEIKKGGFSSCHERGTKEKILSPLFVISISLPSEARSVMRVQ